MAESRDHVVPLSQLSDIEVAKDDPDVRGWEVLGSDGRRVGQVGELIVDRDAMKVRYLEVGIGDDLLGSAGEAGREVLIPIGYARLDRHDNRVFVDTMAAEELAGLPRFEAGPITREYEMNLRRRFDSAFTGEHAENDFYGHEIYDENRFYEPREDFGEERRLSLSEEELEVGRSRRQAGEVEIDKHVETRHVTEHVPVRHEEVVIEHRPPGDMSAETRIEEGEIHVPVSEEELTVQRRTVPREEIVVRKEEVIEDREIDADLRRERAEVLREGDVRVRDDREGEVRASEELEGGMWSQEGRESDLRSDDESEDRGGLFDR